MNNREKIEDLKKQISQLENQMSNCKHVWKEAKYDPEKIMVPDDREGYETHGSDRWPRLSFHEESKKRWSRECSVCGFKEYTFTEELINVNTKPKFK